MLAKDAFVIIVPPQKLMATFVALAVALGAPTAAGAHVWGMAGCSRAQVDEENTAVRYVDAKKVNDLRIEWSTGSVSVIVVDDSKLDGKISISETAPEGWHDTPHMAIESKDGELAVRYGDYDSSGAEASVVSRQEKGLAVTLPKSCAKRLGAVTINGSSGEYALAGIACKTLSAHFEAGIFRTKDVTVDDLSCSATSGQITFDGAVSSSIDASVSSGTARVRTSTTPKKADIEASSGTVELLLPRKAGFTAQVKVGAGSFACDFKTTERDGKLVAGDGEMALNVSVSSGSAHIGKR